MIRVEQRRGARLRAYRAGWRVSVKALGPVELVRDICPGCGGKS